MQKIQTLHPKAKQGVNISREKYDTVKVAIIDCLSKEREISFKDMVTSVSKKLNSFEGSTSWYITTVKLDLEARGEIRVIQRNPQILSL